MRRSVTRHASFWAAAVFLLLCTWQGSDVAAYVAEALESDYSVFSHGVRVGEFRSVCSPSSHEGRKALKFEARTRIHAGFVVYSYDLETKEDALVGDEGTVRYQRSTRENGTSTEVEGVLDHGRFLLNITENGVRRTMKVNRDDYDYTTMECPETRLQREGEERVLRLLDLETLSVVTRRYRWVKSEDVTVDGKRLHCRVIDFEDPNKKCRRWVSTGEPGVIITRQDGKGKSGSYSLRMTHLKDGA